MINTYKDLKGRVWGDEGIPKWIYRSGYFDLEDLPEVITSIYVNELIGKNPGYELFYFSDADCEQFIKEEWGDEYLDLYNTLIPTAYKADFFRYLLLYKYGGIWGDFTQIPLVPMNDFILNVDRVFCMDRPASSEENDFELYNAIMMVKPNDEVVKNAINISKKNISNKDYCTNPLDITGPVVLGQAFRMTKYHKGKFNTKISVGTYNGNKILLNPDLNPIVVDEFKKQMIVKKLGNHVSILYKPENKHYYHAWIDRTVFNT